MAKSAIGGAKAVSKPKSTATKTTTPPVKSPAEKQEALQILHEFNTGTYNPGVENPPTKPFLTAEDLAEYREAQQQYEEGLHNLDNEFAAKQKTTAYEEEQVGKSEVSEREGANWDMAGRGLFQSSIRDADLTDISAAAATKKGFLHDSLEALKVYNEGQKKSQEYKWNQYMRELHRKEVQNAEEVDATMPKWQIEPHWETTPAPGWGAAPSKPAATESKPKFKTNEPIRFNPGQQTSKNGGISAPSTNPSVSPGKQAQPKQTAKAVANNQIAGKLYG